MSSKKKTDDSSVIECLRQLWPDFQLTKNNLVNPTSDIAIKFYTRFICDELQIQIGDIQRTLIENASTPEAFADILNVYALYMCTATVIKTLGLNDMHQPLDLMDLLGPTRPKFKMSLVLLSNFVLYVTDLQYVMDEIKAKVLNALQQTKDIQGEIERVKEKLNEAVLVHIKNTQTKEEWRKRRDAQFKQMQSAQEYYESLQQKSKQAKLELKQLQDACDLQKSEIKDLLGEEEKLKAQIIDDIPKIKRDKKRLVRQKQELLLESEDYKITMNKKMQTISSYEENLKCVQRCLETVPLSQLLDKYETLNQYDAETEHLQKELKLLQDNGAVASNTLKRVKDENDSIQKKIDSRRKQQHDELEQLNQELSQLELQIKEEQNKNSASNELSAKLDKELEETKERSRSYEREIEHRNAEYDNQYKMILELKAKLDNKVVSLIDKVDRELK